MNKKAVDLTINTVVVAILAVLVLVVLFYVFTGKVGIFSKELSVCPGDCMPLDECKLYGGTKLPGANYIQRDSVPSTVCPDVGRDYVCCTVTKP